MVNYEIKGIYGGGPSSFDSSKSLSPSKYPVTAGSMGLTTDPRTANVLREVAHKLSAGVKQIEVEAVSPEIFESIPNKDLEEVNRLAKLTGAELSMHGPVTDSAGFGREGFNESNREFAERRYIQTIERGHKLNPDGNIIINFHSAEGIQGSEYEWDKDGKRKAKKLIVVNKENGKMAPLEPEVKYYPSGSRELKPGVTKAQLEKAQRGEIKESEIIREIPPDFEKGRVYTPEKRVDILNHSEWDNSINQIIFNKERADEILDKNAPQIQHILGDYQKGNISDETLKKFPEQRKALGHYKNAEAYLDDTHQQLQGLFSKAYEFGNEKQRNALKKLSENFQKELREDRSIVGQSRAMNTLLHGLKEQGMAPKMYVQIEEFAADQSSKTFGNTAFEGYKKFGKTAPIVAIENPPAGFALSTGEDLRNLIKKSREHFVKRAKEEGISEKQAAKEAEKLIGATWDVGHINMIRKYGGTKEDILRETETIKPLLKHVHLSDNFGLEHTELPMGMGNVPIKEMMERLGQEGFEARKIIEAGNWFQHFQSTPFQESLEAFGSPIYSVGAGPYWNQSTGLQQGYFSGYGQMLPNINYQTFGAGFSQLPAELGGQQQGAGSRMSGRGME